MPDLRIKCQCCGKLTGRHDPIVTYEVYELGVPIPPYTGPLLILDEVIWPKVPANPNDDKHPGSHYLKMDPLGERCVQLDEPPDRHFKVGDDLLYRGRRGRYVKRWLWDGESWLPPDKPFCSFTCQRKIAPTFWQQVAEQNKG